jgi:hypothetical protein
MNQRLLWSIAGAGLLAGTGLAWLGLSQQAATQSVSENATEETRLPPRVGALGRLSRKERWCGWPALRESDWESC